jgi:hypothetical protein
MGGISEGPLWRYVVITQLAGYIQVKSSGRPIVVIDLI